MGHDVRKELKIIPAQVKVVEHKRAVYSCRACEKHSDHVPIVKAAMPEPVIKGSLASPSAVAHIMTSKICHVYTFVSSGAGMAAGRRIFKPPDYGKLGNPRFGGLAGTTL